jgi:hypothetical protein
MAREEVSQVNRRELFPLGIAAIGSVVAGCVVAKDAPGDPSVDSWTASKHITLPLNPSDYVVAMTSHNGDLVVATKFGEVYRLSLGP